MKKIILSSLLVSTTLLATYSENAYVYKDPRIMGMGGTNVAIGGYSTSLFHNPAGLRSIKKSHGFEVEFLGISASASQNVQEFVNDLDKASNSNDDSEIGNILNTYSGQYFNIGASNYSSISKNGDSTAFSIGLLTAADVNLIPHGNGGAEAPLEVHSRVYGGVVLGVAKSFDEVVGGTLTVGLSGKFISQSSVEGGISISEINDNQDDLAKYLQDKYEKKSAGFGIDAGATYAFLQNSGWNPKLGLSVLNIAGPSMEENYGKQVMTVNLGASISPEVSFLEHFILGVDYVDLLSAQEMRSYSYTTNKVTTSKENAALMKKLRFGASLGLVDNSWFMLTLNGGMYQGSYTAGIDTQLAILKISAATYAEEIGINVGDYSDRRYMATVGIGW